MKSAHSDREKESSVPVSLCFNSLLALCFSFATNVALTCNETGKAMSLGTFAALIPISVL